MTPALVTELKRLESLASSAPWHIGHLSEAGGIHEDAEIDDAEGCMVATVHWRRDQAFMCHLRNSLPTLLEAVETMHAALEEVAAHKGMTNLGECCVDKTCTPAFEDGQKVAYCQFAHGVNRGFNTCAHEASEALARVAALLGEGRGK